MPDDRDRLAAALNDRYTIERQLGAGGMATVYLAHDLKHDRKVAIKVLRPELAAVLGAERFVQEIRTTAALQHPHILPLFDSGQAIVPPLHEVERGTGGEVDRAAASTGDGASFLYYVMPYIEGETLRDKLDRETQLGIDEAVKITTEVADALDYAHRHGVIHRDIKPENILLHDGRPMVADFGIALAVSAAAGGRMTETGMSLGTPHYMSPEQATAEKEITARSDVYSLGSVLYEMLTGEPPHMGNSAQAIIMKIVTEEATPVTKLRRSVPPNVTAAVAKSLEKLAADRFESAKAFAEALENPAFETATKAIGPPSLHPRDRVSTTVLLLGALSSVLAVALGWSLFARPRPETPQPARFVITPDSAQPLVMGEGVNLALSPDGTRLVYVGEAETGQQLWLRSFESLEPEPIPGTAGARNPALSWDGETVAFEVGSGIRTASLPSGPVRRIVEVGTEPAWGDDGSLYYAADHVIYRLRADDEQPEPVTDPAGGIQIMPSALPDGRGLLLTVRRSFASESRIAVVGPEGGAVREILDGTMARFAASGHLVYTAPDGTLLAAPFDLQTLEPGPSVALLSGVRVHGSSHTDFALSATGTLVYQTRSGGRPSQLVWVDRGGTATPVDSAWRGGGAYVALSPDGSRLAAGSWIEPLDGTPAYRLEGQSLQHPAWTPDGDSILVAGDSLFTRPADGSGRAVLTWMDERGVFAPSWSPDGGWLVYRTNVNLAGNGDIRAARPGQDTVARVLAATNFLELGPAISRDGRWLAYISNETGRYEVFVISFPDTGGGRWRVSDAGGTEPVWAHSGRELFYRGPQGEMVAVQVRTVPTFAKVGSRVLFEGAEFGSGFLHRTYDIMPGDQRFVMRRFTGPARPGRMVLVQHFFGELGERVGR